MTALALTHSHSVSEPTIGILAGSGPLAGAHAHQRLMKRAQELYGAREDHDFPEVVVLSRAAGMSAAGWEEAETSGVRRRLEASIRDLSRLGVDVILPACNTFDAFRGELASWTEVPVISLPDAGAKAAAAAGHSYVVALASQRAGLEGLSREALRRRGVEDLGLDPEETEMVREVIAAAMAGHRRDLGGRIATIARGAKARGATALVLGCTELSMLDLPDLRMPVIDALEAGIDEALMGGSR